MDANVLAEVAAELATARSKFKPFNSAHEGYAVLLEEVDELWEEVRKKKSPERGRRIREEAIQVAAMAVRFISDVCDTQARSIADASAKAEPPTPPPFEVDGRRVLDAAMKPPLDLELVEDAIEKGVMHVKLACGDQCVQHVALAAVRRARGGGE